MQPIVCNKTGGKRTFGMNEKQNTANNSMEFFVCFVFMVNIVFFAIFGPHKK